MQKEIMQKYAKTVLVAGVNIKKGQTLIISAPIHCSDIVSVIAEEAYKMGAKRVVPEYIDNNLKRLRYQYETIESLTSFYQHEVDSKNVWVNEDCCRIAFHSENPEIFSSCDAEKMAAHSNSWGAKIKPFMNHTMANGLRWCVVTYPEPAWAKKLFPDLSEKDGMEKLWNMILSAMRLDKEDPVAEWMEFSKKSKVRCNILNNSDIVTYHYENSLGTDLFVDMMEDSVWLAADEKSKDGVRFFANIPTEEIFSAPHRLGVNGTLYSALPLVYHGNIIDKFKLIFKEGRVVDYSAEVGYETLKSIIETDEGSHYLGEIALVQYDSPISNMKTLFYNTLFDENASCHFAFGQGYPTCVKNVDGLDIKGLFEKGLNDSITHEDFMVGTSDLSVTAITKSGEKIPVIKDGNFVI